MSEPEAAPEARRWLRSAREDLRIVRMALDDDPPLVGPASFHSQQAAEKALKAALVLEGIEFPYVHTACASATTTSAIPPCAAVARS